MKALVCIKQVIDHKVKIRIKQDHSGVDLSDARLCINPFDEIAVQEAVLLKEKGVLEEITVVSVGQTGVTDALRTALALGADNAIHVVVGQPLAPLTVAKTLAAVVEQQKPDLMLLGKQAIDDDCNQVGQMLAALLDRPQATNASEIHLSANAATVTREVDGGLETLRLTLPAVVTTDLRLNTPRHISLPDLIKAKKKPIESIRFESLGIHPASRLLVMAVSEPCNRVAGMIVPDVDTLLSKLRNEEKMI